MGAHKAPKNNQKVSSNDLVYAPFYKRVLARLIDSVLFIFVWSIVFFLVVTPLSNALFPGQKESYDQFQNLYVQKLEDYSSRNGLNGYFEEIQRLTDCSTYEDVQNDICKNALEFTQLSTAISRAIIFILFSSYAVFSNASVWKGTLGKIILGIQVTDDKGHRISIFQSLAREFLWIAQGLVWFATLWFPNLILLYIMLVMLIFISCVRIIFSPKKASLHDELAQTIVIERS